MPEGRDTLILRECEVSGRLVGLGEAIKEIDDGLPGSGEEVDYLVPNKAPTAHIFV